MPTLTASIVKEKARALGADLVGIASAQSMNLYPPDPNWPQTPERLWRECRSVVVVAKRMPLGTYRTHDVLVKRMTPHHVMNRLDQITLDLTFVLEDLGAYAVPVPQQVTDTTLKRGTYGPISLRHAAVEAGLGTLGLNMMLVTPEYGPRVYLGAVLTDAELACDAPPAEAYCLGPKCGRCLIACPPDAVQHWGLNKPACATCAQKDGAGAFMRFLHKLVSAKGEDEKMQVTHSLETVDIWQSLRTGVGAYAACPRCFEVCPVGETYREGLRKTMHKSSRALPRNVNASRRWCGQSRKIVEGFSSTRSVGLVVLVWNVAARTEIRSNLDHSRFGLRIIAGTQADAYVQQLKVAARSIRTPHYGGDTRCQESEWR